MLQCAYPGCPKLAGPKSNYCPEHALTTSTRPQLRRDVDEPSQSN